MTVAFGCSRCLFLAAILIVSLLCAGSAQAHGVSGGDAEFLVNAQGMHLGVYFYLGAKHMVTGYDHLLFLLGVVFFLSRFKDVVIFVSLFSLGHSVTLVFGVLSGISVSAYFVDAIIGLSVVYKALDNLGFFESTLGFTPDLKTMTFCFGLVHGFGLSTKLQDIALSADGLVANILAFNVGVEAGQVVALAAILFAINLWRRTSGFASQARGANIVLMMLGFVLFFYQAFGLYIEVTT